MRLEAWPRAHGKARRIITDRTGTPLFRRTEKATSHIAIAHRDGAGCDVDRADLHVSSVADVTADRSVRGWDGGLRVGMRY